MAKITRDTYMSNLHRLFPEYGWASNKGYTCKQHMDALVEKGPTIHHRSNFRNVKEAINKHYEKQGTHVPVTRDRM